MTQHTFQYTTDFFIKRPTDNRLIVRKILRHVHQIIKTIPDFPESTPSEEKADESTKEIGENGTRYDYGYGNGYGNRYGYPRPPRVVVVRPAPRVVYRNPQPRYRYHAHNNARPSIDSRSYDSRNNGSRNSGSRSYGTRSNRNYSNNSSRGHSSGPR